MYYTKIFDCLQIIMKLRFKIISHSSQDASSPITNLISGSGVWQSARFCQYPQQITMQFYEPVTVSSIHIGSHPSKIASKINILFCLPDRTKPNSSTIFQKFGYFEFGTNQNTEYKLRQIKRIQQINQNAMYLRLIIWKNHQNPQNFFNQVGLSQILVFGNPYSTNALPPLVLTTNKSGLMNLSIGDYIQGKLQILQQFKQQFSNQDDFQAAKQIKQIIRVIKSHGDRLKNLDAEKRNAVGSQEYEKAKEIKSQMEDLRSDIEYVFNNFYDPNKKLIKPILKQTRFKTKIDEILSKSDANLSMSQSRVSNKLKKVKLQVLGQQKQVESQNQKQNEQQHSPQSQISKSRISYQNRIIPTVLKLQKKIPQVAEQQNLQDNEFLQKQKQKQKQKNQQQQQQQKQQQQPILQQMIPSAQANASFLFDIYERDIVKKLHSKHWNFKLEALNFVVEDARKWITGTPQLEKNRVKAILFVFNRIVKEGNFQLTVLNLELLGLLVQSKKNVGKNLQTQLHNQLEKSINQLFLKISDNQKIKQRTQQILKKMQKNELYGTAFLYQTIHKSYFNQSLTHNLKIKKHKLSAIDQIIQNFGIGTKDGIPLSSVDFMCKVAEDTNDQIRKQATSILKKMKSKGASSKVKQSIRGNQSLKTSIIKQLES